jgi:hypothetical protein
MENEIMNATYPEQGLIPYNRTQYGGYYLGNYPSGGY